MNKKSCNLCQYFGVKAGLKPVNEDFLQTSVDKVGHQRAVVSTDCLDAFTVHLVVCVCACGEIQTCIALLINEQVWVIHL